MQLSGKVQNVHLGNCGKMDEETAKQKARAIESHGLGYQDLNRENYQVISMCEVLERRIITQDLP